MWSWEVVASYSRLTFTPVPPSWRPSTTRLVLSSPCRRPPVRRDRVPTAPSAMTVRPGSTTARRRATVARVFSVARCARATSTRAASSAAASSTKTSATSADTVDCASASGQACAKKVGQHRLELDLLC